MNNETINEVARRGSYKNFLGTTASLAAIASKASFGDELLIFNSDGTVFDGYVTTAAVNVNGIAVDKETAKTKMSEKWGIINGDARPYARGINETLFNQIKYSESQIFHMPDAESFGVCENEWILLDGLVGSVGFPVILTHPLLLTAKGATALFKGLVGAPEAAHHAQNVAKKAITETWIPKLKSHYLNFDDLAMSMAVGFPDFVAGLEVLHKESHSGIQHRGFVINAKRSTDGSFIRGLKVEFPDYVNVKAPEYTDSMGNTPLITMRVGQWTVKCSDPNFVLQSFKPIFKDNEVTYFDMIFVPI